MQNYPFQKYFNESCIDLINQPIVSNSIGLSDYRNYVTSTNSVNNFNNINPINNNNARTPPYSDESYDSSEKSTESSSDSTSQVEDLKFFLTTAPASWQAGQIIRRYLLPNGEYVSCVLWNNVFYITGTDIVRCLVFRFESFGRIVTNPKKFEEGIFSDLRNLKVGQDAILESPKSQFLDLLFKNNCVRTQKKQKVFYWYSVPHDRLFLDAFERDLKRERANQEPTTVARFEPALSFVYDPLFTLSEQLAKATSNNKKNNCNNNSNSNSNSNNNSVGHTNVNNNYIDYNYQNISQNNNQPNLYNESLLTFDLLKIDSPTASPISSPYTMDNLPLTERNKNEVEFNIPNANENINFFENNYNFPGYALETTKEVEGIDFDSNIDIDMSFYNDSNISNLNLNNNINSYNYYSNTNNSIPNSNVNNIETNFNTNSNHVINNMDKMETFSNNYANNHANNYANKHANNNANNYANKHANNNTNNYANNHANNYANNYAYLYSNQRPYHSSPSLPLSPYINPQELSSSPLDSSSDIFKDKLDGFSSLTDLSLHNWLSDDYAFDTKSQSQTRIFNTEFG